MDKTDDQLDDKGLIHYLVYFHKKKEFEKKYAAIFFKTEAKNIGEKQSTIESDKDKGIDGRYTTHLLNSGMYRNNSLNTTCDKERYMEGSKDWMEHLN